MNKIEVSRYSSRHLKDLIKLTDKVNRLDRAYPPANHESVKKEDWVGWLFGENTVDRLIATSSSQVLGHVSLTPVHEYIKPHLDINSRYFELAQFFVDPEEQKSGVGSMLLEEILSITHSFDRKLSLCVLDESYDARRFYLKHGLQHASSFVGSDGLNHVFLEA